MSMAPQEVYIAPKTALEPIYISEFAPDAQKGVLDESWNAKDEMVRLANHYKLDERLVSAIAFCESGWNPYAYNASTSDWGTLQINEYHHAKRMSSMGLDIKVPKDNIEYGMWLLATEGTRHWKASAKCWVPKISQNLHLQFMR